MTQAAMTLEKTEHMTQQTQIAKNLKPVLRFITCGSVDDGKSTLIGRLLWDSKLVYDDLADTIRKDSKSSGNTDGEIDYSLLVDGLEAEREQGITIDVAYRFFQTPSRSFIVADTPGHRQYTRNMATGASTADLAVILIDARNGVQTQTRRHAFIASSMGIKHFVLAINKMDLVDYNEAVFKKICEDFTKIADKLEISDFTAIPVSALKGENVFSQSEKMKWYKGQHLMAHLETVPVLEIENETHFRMPVQLVQRPHSAYRGYAGTVYGASVSVGDSITIMPKNIQAKVSRLVTFDGDLNTAKPGDTVSLVLDDEYDASRGDVFVAGHLPHISDQFAAKLIWMTEKEMIPGRNYLLKCGTKTVNASITTIKATIDVDTLERSPAKTLQLNDIALCNIAISEKISIDSYSENKATGSFIIIDKDTGNTLGAGMIEHALRRSENIFWSTIDVDKNARATQKKQKPCVLWFTGLSGSGKSTIANLVDKKLFTLDAHSFILDGDNVRLGLCKDLGFNEVDRVENIRRVSQVARLMADAGLIVIVSFISPYKSDRDIARSMFDKDEFAEIYMDTPIDICEQRDPKGLYNKARAGEIKNFTGVNSPYEAPTNPELTLSHTLDADDLSEKVIQFLVAKGILS